MPTDFDGSAFLRAEFGTPGAVLTLLQSYKAPAPTLEAVQKWFQRGTPPGPWLGLLLIYLEIERGGPVSLATYHRAEV